MKFKDKHLDSFNKYLRKLPQKKQNNQTSICYSLENQNNKIYCTCTQKSIHHPMVDVQWHTLAKSNIDDDLLQANGNRFDPDIQKSILPNLNYPWLGNSSIYLLPRRWSVRLQKATDKKRGRPVSWLLPKGGFQRGAQGGRWEQANPPLTVETFRCDLFVSTMHFYLF